MGCRIVEASGQKFWPNGVIPFEFSISDFPAGSGQRQIVQAAIDNWNVAGTRIRLVPRTTETDFIVFVNEPLGACGTFAGKQGGSQQVSCAVAGGNFGMGSIIHEIGHEVGLHHEQRRNDRDNFIKLNNNAAGDSQYSKVGGTGVDMFDYDYGSIMHYAASVQLPNGQIATITTPNGQAIGQRNGLSPRDIFCVNFMYGMVFFPNESWTEGPYYGSRGTFFADVTGDGRADAIVVNNDRVTVRRSTGSGFAPNESWTEGPYYGSRGTFFADVTGDGRADAIVVNDDRITVRRSNGSGFSPNEAWTSEAYYGSRGTFFADVTGDGRADAIAVNDDGVFVKRSTGSGFGPTERWTEGPYFGHRGIFFADVDRDGKADAIVVNNDRVTVRRSNGAAFSSNEHWTEIPYFGSRGTFFADVTGDGRADAIVVNDGGVTVRRVRGLLD